MATELIVTVGAGKQYASILAAQSYLMGLNPIALDQYVTVQVFEDQVMSGGGVGLTIFANNNTDENRYIRFVPAPGLGFQSSGLPTAFPTSGIKLTLNANPYRAMWLAAGFQAQGFRIETSATEAGINDRAPLTIGGFNARLMNCWVTGNNALQPVVQLASGIKDGATITLPTIADCTIIGTGSTTIPVVSNYGGGLLDRTTIVSQLSNGVALEMRDSFDDYSLAVRNTVLIGGLKTPSNNVNSFGRLESVNNLRVGAWTKGGSGSPYPDSAFPSGGSVGTDVLANLTTDLRPKTGGPAIGTASLTARSVNDTNGSNRGVSPDVGGLQLVPAASLPSGTITSVVVDGQNVTVSGTHTLGTSGTVTLNPGTTPNGATQQGPKAVTITGGTWTVFFPDVPPGAYGGTTGTVVNSGGSAAMSGAGFVIVGVDGQPTAPQPDVGEGDASAAGTTWTVTATLLPGAATGNSAVNASAAGTTWTVTATLLPGAAAGGAVVNASAAGTTWTVTATLLPGAAAGEQEMDAQAPGALWAVAVTYFVEQAIDFVASRLRRVEYPTAPDFFHTVPYVELVPMDVDEIDDVPFVFTEGLSEDEKITRVSFEVRVVRGDEDVAAQGMLVGVPAIGVLEPDEPFQTDGDGTAVIQRLSAVGRIDRNVYGVRCVVALSSGRQLVNSAHIKIRKF